MNPLFLDTGYLIALEAADDQHHHEAVAHWNSLSQQPQLLTTAYVFDEAVTFFSSRNRHKKAMEIGHRLLLSRRVQLVYVDANLFHDAWRYFQQRGDKRYSFTDCVSFVLMKQEGIGEALSFDTHFDQAGFVRIPR